MAEAIGRPAYLQVADDLRDKIASEAIPIGTAIPSTQQLVDRYEVSTTVVRAAINELRNEGLLMGQPGKGVFVVRKPGEKQPDTSAILDAITKRLDDVGETVHGLEQRVEQLEAERQAPQPGD
ncbi:MAG: GntR family transcriptional regulator [Micromonosporaceae bacterium]